MARRDFDLVAAWSVCRLSRSLQDLVGFLGELHAKGVDLYLHQQGLDTSTPAGRAMFQMMGVFAEFERAMMQERVKAGLALAIHSARCKPVKTRHIHRMAKRPEIDPQRAAARRPEGGRLAKKSVSWIA